MLEELGSIKQALEFQGINSCVWELREAQGVWLWLGWFVALGASPYWAALPLLFLPLDPLCVLGK